MRVRSALDGSSTPSSTNRLSVFHAVSAARGHLVAAMNCSLTVSARAMVAVVVLQVVGELEQESSWRTAAARGWGYAAPCR